MTRLVTVSGRAALVSAYGTTPAGWGVAISLLGGRAGRFQGTLLLHLESSAGLSGGTANNASALQSSPAAALHALAGELRTSFPFGAISLSPAIELGAGLGESRGPLAGEVRSPPEYPGGAIFLSVGQVTFVNLGTRDSAGEVWWGDLNAGVWA